MPSKRLSCCLFFNGMWITTPVHNWVISYCETNNKLLSIKRINSNCWGLIAPHRSAPRVHHIKHSNPLHKESANELKWIHWFFFPCQNPWENGLHIWLDIIGHFDVSLLSWKGWNEPLRFLLFRHLQPKWSHNSFTFWFFWGGFSLHGLILD